MKLLLVGSDHVWSLEKIYHRYLVELSVEVELFPAQNYFYEYYQQSLLHKLIYRAGLSTIISSINKKLKEKVSQFQPDAIWVFKGMELLPETLKWIREQKIFLINYNPDNPFIFSGYGSGNKNVKESIPLYDLHLTYNLEVKTRLENLGCKTSYLPFGFDLSNQLYQACAQEKEIVKLCFIGNADKERVGFIKALIQMGASIDLYGHDWDKYINDPLATVFPAVYADAYWKTLRRYRVQLNLMRIHNLQSHNMRSFEVPGVGGIMLAPDTKEHRMFFEDGKEFFLFQNEVDCFEKLNYLLSLSSTEAQKIRDKARAKSVEGGYAYKARAQMVLEFMGQVKTTALQ
jgi:spore maturation protein CgeB